MIVSRSKIHRTFRRCRVITETSRRLGLAPFIDFESVYWQRFYYRRVTALVAIVARQIASIWHCCNNKSIYRVELICDGFFFFFFYWAATADRSQLRIITADVVNYCHYSFIINITVYCDNILFELNVPATVNDRIVRIVRIQTIGFGLQTVSTSRR